MSFFGVSRPLIYLKYPNDPANLNASFNLPWPNKVIPDWEPVYREVQTRKGKIYRQRLGWRYKCQLLWSNVSSSDFANMVKIANWQNDILFIPHSDHSLIGFIVEVDDFRHSYPKDRAVHVDVVGMTFLSTIVSPIRDYDNLLNVQNGAVGNACYIKTGAELADNGDFLNWTGDDPDDWEVQNEDVSNYITQNGVNCQLVSDNTAEIRMRQEQMTLGLNYIFTINIIAINSGQLQLGKGGGTFEDIPAKVGITAITFTAGGTHFYIRRKAACDIIFNDVSLKLATKTNLIFGEREVIYN